MTQSSVGKPEAAEERTEQTRSFVRRVRSATRRKYTSEEKIRIVLEGFRREVTVMLSISNIGTDRDPRELSLWRASAEFLDGPVVASALIDRL